MIPNVRKKAWVEQLLTKRAAIERAVGAPLGNMLGCGHWGCVFESTAPWVVKLSVDPTEGPIWSKIAGLVRDEQWGLLGFTEIKSLHRITPDLVTPGGRKKKVWAIVRENVMPVFKEYRSKELGQHGGGTTLATTAHTNTVLGLDGPTPSQAFNKSPYASPRQWTPKQEDFATGLDGLHKYQMLCRAWHEMKRGHNPQAYSTMGVSSREQVEYKISRVVETMFNGAEFAPLGESLNMLAANGIYLRDVHQMNIGWHVSRGDDDWDRIVIFDPGHTPTKSIDGIEEHLIENSGAVVIRPVGWQAANDVVASWTRPGHFYRGMSEDEWRFIQEHRVIRSNERYSLAGEGTNFADHPGDAESYVNFGHSDPRKTGEPNYLVEIRNDGRLKQWRDGYWKAPEVPASLITRAWVMYPEDGAVMAKQVIPEDLSANRRVYHGSTRVFSISEADPSSGLYGPGLYFTTVREEAAKYAKKSRGRHQEPTLYECEVELKNPIYFHRLFHTKDTLYSQWTPMPGADEVRREIEVADHESLRRLKAMGYDGIIVHLRGEQNPEHVSSEESADRTYYIVFDPKSLSCGSTSLTENRRVFHGTPRLFSMSEARIHQGDYGPGFYFTTDDVNALKWATRRAEEFGGVPAILECDVEPENMIDYFDLFPEDANENEPSRRGSASFTVVEKQLRGLVHGDSRTAEERAREMQSLGFDGILVDFNKRAANPKDLQFYLLFEPAKFSCSRREAL